MVEDSAWIFLVDRYEFLGVFMRYDTTGLRKKERPKNFTIFHESDL